MTPEDPFLDKPESEQATLETSQSENVLDLLSDMQSRFRQAQETITSLESKLEKSADDFIALHQEHEKLVNECNKFRMGLFIPLKGEIDPLDIRPINTKNNWNYIQLIKNHGLDAAMSVNNCIMDMAAQVTSFYDVEREKKPLKIKAKKQESDKLKEVENLRHKVSPEGKHEKIQFSVMEKAINAIRRRVPSANMTTLIPFVMAHLPNLSEQQAREALEAIYAKEASAKRKTEEKKK